jgi:hypothetical protein
VAGDRVEYSDTEGRLRATGAVDTRWQLTEEREGAEPTLRMYRVRADTFAYDEARRTAIYEGRPVRLSTDDGEVEGGRMILTLEREERRLESMRVEEYGAEVFAVWPGGYEALGTVLTYHASAGTYVLEGRSARLKAPKAEGTSAGQDAGCTLTESPVIEFNRTTRAFRTPAGGQAPRSDTPILCSTSLRKAR